MLQLPVEVTERRALIYMTGALCTQPVQVLESRHASRIIQGFLDRLRKRDSELLKTVGNLQTEGTLDNPSPAAQQLARLLGLLVDMSPNDIKIKAPDVARLVADVAGLAEFVEELYDYWRGLERYLIFEGGADESRDRAVLGHMPFVENNQHLNALIREAYRRIERSLRGIWPRVYRQVPAGANMSLLLDEVRWPCPGGHYETLRNISLVRLAMLTPPVVLYPRFNYREGKFVKVDYNPLQGVSLSPEQWLGIPIRVGELQFIVFFDREYLALAMSLVNLFELSGHVEARCKPDGILVFGLSESSMRGEQTIFYVDEEEDIAVGGVLKCEEVDYFGYFKKMILTLHNVKMVQRGRLPVHGAMCRVRLRGGPTAGLVIVGDSGAGKSETLDAFQQLADEWISDLLIIFDDMGSLACDEQGRLLGYGTEIGAFVRLDDLDKGYAFGQLDRSIIMNPQRQNARVVLPVTRYEHVVAGYQVDILLYANNYEPVDEQSPAVELFSEVEQALQVFRAGQRAAKGTTDERGLVSSYFGNPFGAPQMKDKHEALAREYFEAAYSHGIVVGQIRTRLGLEGWYREGPRQAAEALFRFLLNQYNLGE